MSGLIGPMNLEELNRLCKGSFIDFLHIEYTEFTGDSIKAVMQITPQLYQPDGFVHGGAMISLAESVGSAGSFMMVDPDNSRVLGLSVNSQHLFPARSGKLHATGRLIAQRGSMHIWDVEIRDDSGELVSISRVTNRIKSKSS